MCSRQLPATAKITSNRLTFATFPILGYSLTTKNHTVSQTRSVGVGDLRPEAAAESRRRRQHRHRPGRPDSRVSCHSESGEVAGFGCHDSRSRQCDQAANIIDSPGLYWQDHQLVLGAGGCAGARHSRACANSSSRLPPMARRSALRILQMLCRRPSRFTPIVSANGKPAVLLNIARQPSSNTVAVADGVAAEVAQLRTKSSAGRFA